MNFSGVRLDMSFKEAKELDAILARDKAKPARKEDGAYNDTSWTMYFCPTCNSIIYKEDKFCKYCGQRIDTENDAL